jgi:hypothetical protein
MFERRRIFSSAVVVILMLACGEGCGGRIAPLQEVADAAAVAPHPAPLPPTEDAGGRPSDAAAREASPEAGTGAKDAAAPEAAVVSDASDEPSSEEVDPDTGPPVCPSWCANMADEAPATVCPASACNGVVYLLCNCANMAFECGSCTLPAGYTVAEIMDDAGG